MNEKYRNESKTKKNIIRLIQFNVCVVFTIFLYLVLDGLHMTFLLVMLELIIVVSIIVLLVYYLFR